ncbi:MAG: FkbM family methyltransferase [Candidatus Aenigmarchaeota archaeon]|nr:FkbM family methyltransferase [Candidatus Aenigmarchaeota archaeon]
METRCQTTDLGTMHTHFIGKENDRFLSQLSENPVIIDIGAHIGTFSIYAIKKIPAATIYSFEPHPDNYEILMKNIRMNGFERSIMPFRLAVFNKKGNLNLYFRKRYTAGCTLIKEKNNEHIKVKCITIKDIFDSKKIDRCDLLKLDCEGVDYKIIASIPKNYFKRIKFIQAEFHTKKELELMSKALQNNNFRTDIKWFTKEYGNIYAQNSFASH